MVLNRWKLTFEYDGTAFSGWQKQPGERTVQGVIEQAFSTLYQTGIDISGQGRTDAGVHALGQVAHTDLPASFDSNRLLHAMRGLLPQDVALKEAVITHADFHARFHAVSRSYSYRITQEPSPLHRHSAWYHPNPADIRLLRQCAELVKGEHDFVNFCIPSGENEANTLCSIRNSEWGKNKGMIVYRITGNRFLRHMVRRLAGTMIWVSDGKFRPDQFERLLSGKTVQRKGHAAPARGLILERVDYK